MKFLHAVLLAALASTGNAMAQISADASISGVRYELFDLDPDDGITPSLTLQPSTALAFNSYASFTVDDDKSGYFSHGRLEGTQVLAPVSVSHTYTSVQGAQASLSGAFPHTLALSASARTYGRDALQYVTSEVSTGLIEFSLSPMTAVRFSADLAGTALIGSLPTPGLIPSASAYLRMVLGWESGDTWEHLNAQLSSDADFTAGGSTQTLLGQLSSENRRERASNNFVYFEAHASAVAYPPLPVPEAPTVAMLFAGLGVLLLRLRHAQQEA